MDSVFKAIYVIPQLLLNERMLLFPSQVKDLEQSLQASEEKLKQSADVVAAQEAQIQELVSGDCGCRVLGP